VHALGRCVFFFFWVGGFGAGTSRGLEKEQSGRSKAKTGIREGPYMKRKQRSYFQNRAEGEGDTEWHFVSFRGPANHLGDGEKLGFKMQIPKKLDLGVLG
jgi:hypothetical protein